MATHSAEQFTIIDKGSFHDQRKSEDFDSLVIVHKPLWERLPIFNPYDSFKVTWDIILAIALLMSVFETPLSLAFHIDLDQMPWGLQIFLLSIDIFLCIDIMVTFRTAYHDEYDLLRLIDDPVLIAKRYLRFWFWFDVLTSFPFDFVFTRESDVEGFASYIKILRLVRVIRMFRIVRVVRILSQSRAAFKFSPSTIHKFNILKIAMVFMFFAHFFACLWYVVGVEGSVFFDQSWIVVAGMDDPDLNIFERYSTSLYWSVITLFTTGYGDIFAHNILEQWVAIICVAFGSMYDL